MKPLIITLLFLLSAIQIKAKYEIILDRIELPFGADDPYIDMGTFRVRKFNRSSSVYSGVFTIKNDLTNDLVVSFEAFNLSGGQYKRIFSNTVGRFCDVIYEKALEKTAKAAFVHSNSTTPYGTCPLPAQSIHVDNYAPDDLGDAIPPYMPGNERWILTLWLSKDNVKVSGLRVYSILRDEQKLFDSKW